MGEVPKPSPVLADVSRGRGNQRPLRDLLRERGGRDSEGAFLLTETPILADLAWRLIIDWGVATRIWRQNGVTARKKPVLAIVERAVDRFLDSRTSCSHLPSWSE